MKARERLTKILTSKDIKATVSAYTCASVYITFKCNNTVETCNAN